MKRNQLAIDGGAPVHPGAPIPISKVCYDEREEQAVQRVFDSGVFCSVFDEATEVPALEQEFAQQVQARYAVAFNSGTTAQHAALAALGLGPGAEVIVPDLTFVSTAYTVRIAGADPVFCDVCADTFTMDPRDVDRRLTSRTKAVVPVHWLGNAAAMDDIVALANRRGLVIVEDCAHGPGITCGGKQIGRFGRIACWSMQQSKMLTSAGEGGIATTDDAPLATRLRQVRDHGKAVVEKKSADLIAPYRVTCLGNNYRLSEMQAAFARVQLGKLRSFIEQRRRAYSMLAAKLAGVAGIQLQERKPGCQTSAYCFPVLFPRRSFRKSIEQISAALYVEGVENYAIGLYESCHVHPLFSRQYLRSPLPTAEQIAKEILLLPLHPELSETETDDIAQAVMKVVHAYCETTTRT